MAERARYVEVLEYSAITAALASSSQDVAHELAAAKEARSLHSEKYTYVKRAKELLDALAADIAKFVRLMPIKQPDRIPRAAKAAPARYKPPMPYEEKELVARSRRALANLQKNLAELKAELGEA